MDISHEYTALQYKTVELNGVMKRPEDQTKRTLNVMMISLLPAGTVTFSPSSTPAKNHRNHYSLNLKENFKA